MKDSSSIRSSLFAALLVLITLLAFFPAKGNEPLHRGRPIYAWLADLEQEAPETRERAAKELRVIGTNAIPSILAYITSPYGAFSSANSRIARSAFNVLGSSAAPAIPSLVVLLNDENFSDDAASALKAIGEKSTLPLLSALTNQNPKIRMTVLETLQYGIRDKSFTNLNVIIPKLKEEVKTNDGAIGALMAACPDGEIVIRELLPKLQSHDASTRRSAASCLGIYKNKAKTAVPSLIRLLKDPDPDVRSAAGRSLESIDPAAAQKAGYKAPVYE